MPFRGTPRKGTLPEHTAYTDSGCELSPQCLICPEPVCRYDHPLGARGIRELAARQLVFDLLRLNLTAQEVSHRAGVGIRTVFRLKRQLTPSR